MASFGTMNGGNASDNRNEDTTDGRLRPFPALAGNRPGIHANRQPKLWALAPEPGQPRESAPDCATRIGLRVAELNCQRASRSWPDDLSQSGKTFVSAFLCSAYMEWRPSVRSTMVWSRYQVRQADHVGHHVLMVVVGLTCSRFERQHGRRLKKMSFVFGGRLTDHPHGYTIHTHPGSVLLVVVAKVAQKGLFSGSFSHFVPPLNVLSLHVSGNWPSKILGKNEAFRSSGENIHTKGRMARICTKWLRWATSVFIHRRLILSSLIVHPSSFIRDLFAGSAWRGRPSAHSLLAIDICISLQLSISNNVCQGAETTILERFRAHGRRQRPK